MMKNRIVFITDCSDVAYSELRATVLKEYFELNQNYDVDIEPVVSVKPFSIINGNFILRLMAESYPDGTIFSVVLNPSQNRPERLIGKTKLNNFTFLGANTGVFDWFLRDFGISELYELNDPGFLPFGGKYVHAPAVAKVASGIQLSELGKPFPTEKINSLNLTSGEIVHIDNFGLMKFNTVLPQMNEGDEISLDINGSLIKAIYTKRMMARETNEWVVYPGSSLNLPELGLVRKNGANELGVKEGDIIKFIVKD